MDELRRHAAPLIERWQRLSRGQRLGVAIMVVVGAVGFLFFGSRHDDAWRPIAGGREFTKSERSAIQSTWRKHGLKSFRLDGNALAVPKGELTRYEAALPKLKSDETDAGSEWEKQLSRANLFTSHEQLEQLKENALRNELRRALNAIPNIASADVIWARSKGRLGLSGRSKVTATINVTPRDGYDITPDLADSLRTAVASMIPDLSSDDIVVLDQSTGLAITETSSSLIAEQQRRRQQERLARQLESKVAETLAHIPGAIVHVRSASSIADAERRRSDSRQRTIAEQSGSHQHFTAKPSIETAIVSWRNDLPQNFIDFKSLLPDGIGSAGTATERDDSEKCHIEIQIPKSYFDAHFARRCLANRIDSTLSDTSSASFEDIFEAELFRLRGSVQNMLLPDHARIDLSVAPEAEVATIQMVPPFAAWPHAICTFIAVLCVAASLRPTFQKRSGSASEQTHDELSDLVSCGDQPQAAAVTSQEINPPISPTSAIVVDVSDLARLQQLNSQRLADVLCNERPQAIAVLLTRFSTRHASECLSQLFPSLQTEVIRRLKSLCEVPDEVVAEIAHTVCSRLSQSSGEPTFEPSNRIGHLLRDSAKARAFT